VRFYWILIITFIFDVVWIYFHTSVIILLLRHFLTLKSIELLKSLVFYLVILIYWLSSFSFLPFHFKLKRLDLKGKEKDSNIFIKITIRMTVINNFIDSFISNFFVNIILSLEKMIFNIFSEIFSKNYICYINFSIYKGQTT
jgi:hypothetical protein